jgi:hypothetical protein
LTQPSEKENNMYSSALFSCDEIKTFSKKKVSGKQNTTLA